MEHSKLFQAQSISTQAAIMLGVQKKEAHHRHMHPGNPTTWLVFDCHKIASADHHYMHVSKNYA
jgi:hypothetical protein